VSVRPELKGEDPHDEEREPDDEKVGKEVGQRLSVRCVLRRAGLRKRRRSLR
jgi:hypothetical protein